MFKFIFSLFLLHSLAFAGPHEEAAQLLNRFSQETDVTVRLDLFSRQFLGLPYGENGPLGEGPEARYDQDPLYRFDTFDCTTFVETMVSLATSVDVEAFEKRMDEIRYEDSTVDYLKRNHFPSLQWIPNNVQNGLLREINDLVLDESEQLVAQAVIDLPGWLKKIRLEDIQVPLATLEERQTLREELQGMASQYSPIVARLSYLPIATLLARPLLLDKIPHGTLVNFVRPNWDLTDTLGTHMNVSHQGLLFRKDKILYLRHAGSVDRLVIEYPLINYLKKFENHPTLKGIHLMQMNLQP